MTWDILGQNLGQTWDRWDTNPRQYVGHGTSPPLGGCPVVPCWGDVPSQSQKSKASATESPQAFPPHGHLRKLEQNGKEGLTGEAAPIHVRASILAASRHE
jgi:hypothetical protein